MVEHYIPSNPFYSATVLHSATEQYRPGSKNADGAQHASSEGAEVRMALFAGTGVEGVVSELRSCSVWIVKLNQASGSTTDGPAGMVEIRRSRPWRNLTTKVHGLVHLESSTRLRNSSRYSPTDRLP